MEIDIIKTLENIQKHCINHKWCKECEFRNITIGNTVKCSFEILAKELSYLPCDWDMEKIKEIINE